MPTIVHPTFRAYPNGIDTTRNDNRPTPRGVCIRGVSGTIYLAASERKALNLAASRDDA